MNEKSNNGVLKIALISDTHSSLRKDVLEHLEDADEIWHAGDIGNISLLNQISEITTVRAVWGNIDGNDIRIETSEMLKWTIQGIKFFMIHIGGYPGRYTRKAYEELMTFSPDVFICGHSHILKVIRDKKLNLIHMNPGACGIYGFHQIRTLIKFDILDGKMNNLRVIELGPRT